MNRRYLWLSLFLCFILSTSNSFASENTKNQESTESNDGMCVKQKEGQTDENYKNASDLTKKADEGSQELKILFCLIQLPLQMSPGDIVSETCEDGSQPCMEVLKETCKFSKRKGWNHAF